MQKSRKAHSIYVLSFSQKCQPSPKILNNSQLFLTDPLRTPIKKREVIDKAVDEMLEADVIRRSRSPWSFPVVIVDKKDGSKRFCVDFRKLNQVIKKNSYPLPLIDDILALLRKAKYFTSLDLKSGYWQVAKNETDKEKTDFACHRGLFEFNVMPFGLSNAPAVFKSSCLLFYWAEINLQ